MSKGIHINLMFFDQVVKINPMTSGKLGCLTDISFGYVENVDDVITLKSKQPERTEFYFQVP